MQRLTTMPRNGVACFALVWSIGLVSSLLATAGWSQQPSITWLGTQGGAVSGATGVSADGSVVVSYAYNADEKPRAYRWANSVMQDLGTLSGYDSSVALGASADGSVVIGYARSNAAFQNRAFR